MASPYLSAFIIALLTVLSGCAVKGGDADYTDRTQQLVDGMPAWSESIEGQPVAALSDLIESEPLDQLVQQALAANPGLQQTLLTLRIREAELKQAGAERLPQLDAGFSAGKTEDADTQYTGSVSVSWEVDLWQRIGDRTAAAGKDVDEQAELYRSARDTLAADVMTSWLALIAQQHAIDIEQQRLATLKNNEELILQRYRNGLGTLEDLDSARSSSASSRATLESYQETLAQQQRDLRTLLGDLPTTESTLPGEYPAVLAPLADLPAQTLQRRPDLTAAYRAIEAADYRASAAYKDLLPSISLQAALEDVANSPGQALLTDPAWSLLGQLTAPLFRGGALQAAADAADLDTARLYQVYRETLLNAVTEVENALGLELSLARRQTYIASALARQQSTLEQYRTRYRAGLVDILDLLSVQGQTYDLKAQLDDLIFQRLTNRIDLGLALGLGVNS